MTGKRPTLADVAARAGVSIALVSIAMRGAKGVSATTREHILAAAREIGLRSGVMRVRLEVFAADQTRTASRD